MEELQAIGWGAEPAKSIFAFCDPLPERERPRGENKEGVGLRTNPLHWLATHGAHAQRVVDRFRVGLRKVTERSYRELSAYEIEALILMSSADHRANVREAEERARQGAK